MMSAHPFNHPDYHVITDCGELKSGYTYQGYYGFNFSFGAAQIFIYKLRSKYQVVSRSYVPLDSHGSWLILKVSQIGYVLGEYQLLCQAVRKYLIEVNRFTLEASPFYAKEDVEIFSVPEWSSNRCSNELSCSSNSVKSINS